jgi:uncharacterized protein DUF397
MSAPVQSRDIDRDDDPITWHKSSHSPNESDCVEIALALGNA